MRNSERTGGSHANSQNTPSREGEGVAEGVGETIRTGTRMAKQRSAEVRSRLNVWRDEITRQTREHPGRSLALAIGAGYVVGGGLLSALTARLLATGLRIGLRLAVIPLVTQSLASMGENIFGGQGMRDDDAADSSQTRSEMRNGKRHPDQKENNS